jgi:hypothetical protein
MMAAIQQTATILAAASTASRPPKRGQTPLYGLAQAEDDRHLLREKRMALTRGQRWGKACTRYSSK